MNNTSQFYFVNKILFAISFVFAAIIGLQAQEVVIQVSPNTNRSINGKLELERKNYFSVAHGGENFESTINNKTLSDHYLQDLGISFGRNLGMVNSAVKWSTMVKEDAARPGYADLVYMKSKAKTSNGSRSSVFLNAFPVNLDVANHENQQAYPTFMPQITNVTAGNEGLLPTNTKAAGELAVGLLKYNYTDWSRPATYEPINEPHWAIDGTLLANLHLDIWQRAKDENLSTKIGGPCMSVGYFYKNSYQYFSTLSKFIDNTQCKLDFYSFHVYDFLEWNSTRNDFTGRVSTGLPIEGVLDLVPNYTQNKYGKPVELVFSEHGGYINKNEDAALNTIANTYFPGSGFDWEMKRRSVSNFVMVSSAIANTMAFMNHPDVVRKSVPFIILESFSWDPKYYSSLLVANNFTDKTQWQESQLVHFFEFFKGVKGRRVLSDCTNPDIQQQSFVDGNKLIIVLNNLSTKVQSLKLNLALTDNKTFQVRRFGRNVDFTPYLTENTVSTLDGLQLVGREAMIVTVDCYNPILASKQIDEKPFYGTAVTQQFTGSKTFTVNVSDLTGAEYAYLRVGIGRPAGTDKKVNISINGTTLVVQSEECASFLEDANDYATTKTIRIDKSLLKTTNDITVSFPDGKTGGVGAVVLRVGYSVANVSANNNVKDNTKNRIYPNPVMGSQVNIDLSEFTNKATVKLLDAASKIQVAKTYYSTKKIIFEFDKELDKGLYLVQVEADNEEFANKIIIQ